MPIIILHGNALSAISKKVSEIRAKFDSISVIEINGKETSFDESVVKLSTGGLFSESRVGILENFDERIDLEKIPNDPNATVVIKFNKPLTASSSFLKSATKLKAQIIQLSENDEVSVFPFLDALGEKNSQKAYSEFEKLFAEYGSQYLLTMIFYLFRRLVVTPKRLPQFVMNKLNKQRGNFSQEKITSLYKEALETDFRIKTGKIDDKLGLTLLVDRILTA